MSNGEHPLKSALLEEYQAIYKGQPDQERQGYDDVKPAIPFVGEDYPQAPGKPFPRVLVYASAENRVKGGKRGFCRAYEGRREVEEFRDVHIQPFNNGDLLTVARYLLQKIAEEPLPGEGPPSPCPFADRPGEFIEQIAVANYSKFALEPVGKKKTRQRDPLDERGSSLSYVAKDLSILQPEILILPYTIYWKSVKRHWETLMGPGEVSLPRIIIGGPQAQPGPFNALIPGWLAADPEAPSPGDRDYSFRYAFPTPESPLLKQQWIEKCERAPGVATYLKWIDTWRPIPDYEGKPMIRKSGPFCRIASSRPTSRE